MKSNDSQTYTKIPIKGVTFLPQLKRLRGGTQWQPKDTNHEMRTLMKKGLRIPMAICISMKKRYPIFRLENLDKLLEINDAAKMTDLKGNIQ